MWIFVHKRHRLAHFSINYLEEALLWVDRSDVIEVSSQVKHESEKSALRLVSYLEANIDCIYTVSQLLLYTTPYLCSLSSRSGRFSGV